MEQTLRACPNCSTQLPPDAAFCYTCGTSTPAGIDRRTGALVAPDFGAVTMADVLPRLRAALGRSYELGERIGAGGFAEVFRARDLRLKRDVAVKVTRPDFAVNPVMMVRFRREAETIAALRHPNIMPIYDIGETSGLAYIVMPYVVGESLRARLDREGRLSAEQARRILLQAADALAAAHEAGLVHRDVKPDNIMLDRREDQVLLMDFGIAKAVEAGADGPALTSTGLVMGTPHYMSPEQAGGERAVDARADQYALGVIGYRMLSGVLPFDGPSVRSVLAKQILGAATPLRKSAPGTPPALSAAIHRAMAKDPDQRFASMREFVAALRADPTYAVEVLSTTGARPLVTVRAVRAVRATRVQWLAAVASVIAIGGGVLGAFLMGGARHATSASAPRVESAVRPAPARADSVVASSPAPAAASKPDSVAGEVPDSAASRLAADSALVRRAGLKIGTPEAASFLANVALSRRRPCEQLYAEGRFDRAAAVCGAVARLGRSSAMRTLGLLAERAGHPDSAAAWYQRAGTDVDAQVHLAQLLDDGSGVAKDVARATTLLSDAAGRGSLVAQRTLGDRYTRGLAGLPRDDAKAATWYGGAASAGDVPSMLAMAEHFRTGRGVKKSDDSAAAWWRRAAERHDSAGEYRLGMAYLRGKGVPKSDSVALTWLRLAAAQGHEGARFEIQKRANK
jgi:serine/threonine-protein kinase